MSRRGPQQRDTNQDWNPVEELLTVAQAAARSGFAAKTFYNWIEFGRLRSEHGLRYFGRSIRIDWTVFKSCFERGDFGCT